MHSVIGAIVLTIIIEIILAIKGWCQREYNADYRRGIKDGNYAAANYSRLHSTISAQQRGMKRQRKLIRRLQNQLKPKTTGEPK